MYHVHDNIFTDAKGNVIIDFFTFLLHNLSGNTGNIIFITISALYLIKSKGPKLNKIFFLMLIQAATAIIMLFFVYFFKMDKVNYYMYKVTLFPFLTHTSYWYINAYIVYYMIHGFLNRFIDIIDKREHRMIVVLSLFYYMVLPMAFRWPLHNRSFVTNFIVVHFLVSYIDKYMKDFNFSKSTKVLSALYLFILIFVYCLDIVLNTYRFRGLMNRHVAMYYNLILVLLIVSLVFNKSNIKMKPSALIYTISSLSLYIYLIHYYTIPNEIGISADIFEKHVWKYLDGRYSYVIDRLLYFGAAVLYFFANVALAYIYRMLISPILNPLSDKIANIITKTWIKLEEKCDKNN